jgi:hypothetical protein
MITKEITDSLGRAIRLREIGGKTRIAFYRALGARDSSNVGVVMEYWNTMAVESIDGRPIPSFKALVDVELVHAEIEKGNVSLLIDKFLADVAKEKENQFPLEDSDDIKK